MIFRPFTAAGADSAWITTQRRRPTLRRSPMPSGAWAEDAGVKGKEITPFLLAHIVELTGGDSLKTNIQLAYNNARAAARIAVELARL